MGLRLARSRPFFFDRFACSGLATTSSNACTISAAVAGVTPRTACTCWFRCARLGGADTANENALEELARTAASSAIDMASDRVLEPKPCTMKNRRIEIPRVVDDDHDGRILLDLFRRIAEHGRHVADVRSERT